MACVLAALFIHVYEIAQAREVAIDRKDQQGSQWGEGTPLAMVPEGEELMVGLSTPKYSKDNNSRIYLIRISQGKASVVGRTPPLPPELDPQGVAVYRNELIVANHQSLTDAIVIYDLGAAFSGELKVIGKIPNLPRPTRIRFRKGQLYVLCYGFGEGDNYWGQGLYVYAKDADGVWRQVRRYQYENLFGPGLDHFTEWENFGPIALAVRNRIAYVVSQVSSSIALIDLDAKPKHAYLGRIAGSESKLFYPLGIAFHEDKLFVSDHLHDFIAQYDASGTRLGVGDPLPEKIVPLPDRGKAKYKMVEPYAMLIAANRLFVSSTMMPELYMYDPANLEKDPAIIPLPDNAIITTLGKVNHAAD